MFLHRAWFPHIAVHTYQQAGPQQPDNNARISAHNLQRITVFKSPCATESEHSYRSLQCSVKIARKCQNKRKSKEDTGVKQHSSATRPHQCVLQGRPPALRIESGSIDGRDTFFVSILVWIRKLLPKVLVANDLPIRSVLCTHYKPS